MSQVYQPLHHKYRPERFDELVGQEAITTTLKQALLRNRIAPAYLFCGPRGTGKTSSARIIARSLNCQKSQTPTPEPCGKCDLCTSISSGTCLDVIEIDAASNTGVDNIREIIERSKFAPVQARWKVYVVDECHMLSTAAFNALLKTLEEPPPRVVFVLATTDPQRVLPTILSRCQRFDFRRIGIEPLKKHLGMIASNEAIAIEPEALHLISQKAQGGLRDAESMLDQLSLLPGPITTKYVWDLLGAVPEQELISIAAALVESNPVKLLEECRQLFNHGRDPIAILQGLASILRDLVLLNAAPNKPELINISSEFQQELTEISNKVKQTTLLYWQAQLKGTESQLKLSVQPRLWLEVILLGILSRPSLSSEDTVQVQQTQTKIEPNLITTKKGNSNELVQDLSLKTEAKFNDPSTGNEHSEKSIENLDSQIHHLTDLWQQILGRLELPSTRMLLSQQAKLTQLTPDKAVVKVSDNWMGMVQSRINLLEQAINETLGSSRTLILEKNIISTSEKSVRDTNLQRSLGEDATEKAVDTESKTNNKTVKSSIKSEDPQTKIVESKNIKTIEPIENQAKNLADFFNGKVLDL